MKCVRKKFSEITCSAYTFFSFQLKLEEKKFTLPNLSPKKTKKSRLWKFGEVFSGFARRFDSETSEHVGNWLKNI